jgi:predicted nucleic acid-binding Zn finger protein
MTTISPAATIRALNDRLNRAESLVAEGKVHPVYGMSDHYIVEGKDAQYLVNGRCICPDSANRTELRGWCKHKLAASIYAEQEAKADTPQPAWTEEDEVKLKELF